MERFCIGWTDEEEGLYCERLYWTTNGRCFIQARDGGVIKKPRRISEAEYISAWEQYRNY